MVNVNLKNRVRNSLIKGAMQVKIKIWNKNKNIFHSKILSDISHLQVSDVIQNSKSFLVMALPLYKVIVDLKKQQQK